MNSLFLDEYPLIILPKLAVNVGLNEAVVLQQIHYWVKKNEKREINFRDGFYWVYNTYKDWQANFPFWSVITVKRIFKKLKDSGLLISSNYNELKMDQTKWYRINYELE